ncbi:hypothetical protein HN51_068383, partial [Arachis hypogaea]
MEGGYLSQRSSPLRMVWISVFVCTCIYELYNEDMKSGPLSEKNWGLFNANGAPKKGKTPDSYHFDGVASISTTDPKLVSCNFTQAGGEDLRLDLG